MSQLNKVFILIFCLFFSALSNAKDLGIVGEVYPVAEEDFVVFIKNKLQAMKGTKKYNELQNSLKSSVQEEVDRPPKVTGLSVTQTPKSFTVDPSIVLTEDLVNGNGQVIKPAGTRVNPLSRVKLRQALLFYNSDDPKQVSWAAEKTKQFHKNVKLILVGGGLKSQLEQFKRPVYFDQNGRLVSYFNITQVPAVVTQQGLSLLVKEEKPL